MAVEGYFLSSYGSFSGCKVRTVISVAMMVLATGGIEG